MTSIQQPNPWTPEFIQMDKELKEKYGPAAHVIPAPGHVTAPQSAEAINAKYNPKGDTVSFNGTENDAEPKKELTLEEKKEIKHQARNTATGWSIFGGVISTAYFALRSDKTIAKKYNLDVEKDKDFIKEIRKDQTLWTVPGAMTEGPLGVVAWIYSKCQDASDMTIKSENK